MESSHTSGISADPGESPSLPLDVEWDRILQELEANRAALSRGGSIHRRRETGTAGYFALRFRVKDEDGQRRNRAISLGSDPQVVERVKQLIAGWRAAADPRRNGDPEWQRLYRDLDRLLAMLPNRVRHCARAQYREAGGDIRKVVCLTFELPRLLQREMQRTRPGRPYAGALQI